MSYNKRSVLVVGAGAGKTGQARVLEKVISHLSQEYNIHHFAIDYRGDTIAGTWNKYSNCLAGDTYGIDGLENLIEKIHPQIILIFSNLIPISHYRQHLDRYKGKLKTIGYAAVIGRILNNRFGEVASYFDKFVVFTPGVAQELCDMASALHSNGLLDNLPSISSIPHGVDPNSFHPLVSDARLHAKKHLFGEGCSSDSFIVLNANRNVGRKRIDITIEGFAQFAYGKPAGVKLYLHMGRGDGVYPLRSLIRKLGIEDRVILPLTRDTHPEVSDEQLNLIYNACDIGLNTASTEGWGLVTHEHAATGAPQIVPRFGVFSELWAESACMMNSMETSTASDGAIEENLVSPSEVAQCLERLYQDRTYRTSMSKKAYERAISPQYLWHNIAKQWDHLFQSLLDS